MGRARAVTAPLVVALLGLTGETGENAERFLLVILVGGLPAALGPTLDAAFIAIGRTRAMMGLQSRHGLRRGARDGKRDARGSEPLAGEGADRPSIRLVVVAAVL